MTARLRTVDRRSGRNAEVVPEYFDLDIPVAARHGFAFDVYPDNDSGFPARRPIQRDLDRYSRWNVRLRREYHFRAGNGKSHPPAEYVFLVGALDAIFHIYGKEAATIGTETVPGS